MSKHTKIEALLNTPCLHETNPEIPVKKTVYDYHPLSWQDMRTLILHAFRHASNGVVVSQVQCRLQQAVPGAVCPHDIDGPVAEKQTKLSQHFVHGIRTMNRKSTLKKVGKVLGLKP